MQNLVTVFGGSGFLGHQVVRALARAGWRIRVAVRQPNLAYAMRLHGDVGQIDVVQANVRDEASVRRALDGASAAVNLAGVLYEAGPQKFERIHVEGAANVAGIAAERGIARLVHVSALGADPAARSVYAASKGRGEDAVRALAPAAAILRPSVMFGQGDGFFEKFAAMAMLSPALPLVGGGHTRFQPVYVGDVARAVVRALEDPAAAGQVYELGGPADHSFRELMEMLLAEIRRRRFLVPLPFPVAGAIGSLAQLTALVGVAPVLTADQAVQLRTDNVVSGRHPGLAELGIAPTTLESVLPTYLYRYRRGGQFAEEAAAV